MAGADHFYEEMRWPHTKAGVLWVRQKAKLCHPCITLNASLRLWHRLFWRALGRTPPPKWGPEAALLPHLGACCRGITPPRASVHGAKPLRAEFFHRTVINGECKKVVGNTNRVHKPLIKHLLKPFTLAQPLTSWLGPQWQLIYELPLPKYYRPQGPSKSNFLLPNSEHWAEMHIYVRRMQGTAETSPARSLSTPWILDSQAVFKCSFIFLPCHYLISSENLSMWFSFPLIQ